MADDGVVPTKALEMPTPVIVATMAVTNRTIVQGRRLAECKSFISRTVGTAHYARPSNTQRVWRFCVNTPHRSEEWVSFLRTEGFWSLRYRRDVRGGPPMPAVMRSE